jgi:transcriptional regulator with XRE-family HTH domain
MAKTSNIIDKLVGARIRARRLTLQISQQKLGNALGVTFQQVQKYEKGTNRIGVGRLQQIATFLGVSPSFFLEGMGAPPMGRGTSVPIPHQSVQGFSDDGAPFQPDDTVAARDGLALMRVFVRIKDPYVRQRVVSLVASMAEGASFIGDDDTEGHS